MPVDMGAERVSSGVRPNKKSHPRGWLDWFINRFARLAYAASPRFRETKGSRLRAPTANNARLEGSGITSERKLTLRRVNCDGSHASTDWK